MFSCKEARKYVKENISGKHGTILGYAVLYMIFRGLINGFLSSFDGILGFIVPIVAAGVVTPIQVGLFRIMTNIMNGKPASFSMLFEDYKYFVNLFIIGLLFNLVIQAGYKIYIVGIFLDYIYVGVLYFFIYNSNLELSEFFNKLFEKVKDYFGECVLLELSYVWPFVVATIAFTVIFAIAAVITLVGGFDQFSQISTIEDLLPILASAIPLLLIALVYLIVMLVLVIILTPRLLLAEAKFYSVFANQKVTKNDEKSKANFCSNCGAKVEGKFCNKCGAKIKE